jgi:hypothetical protein
MKKPIIIVNLDSYEPARAYFVGKASVIFPDGSTTDRTGCLPLCERLPDKSGKLHTCNYYNVLKQYRTSAEVVPAKV